MATILLIDDSAFFRQVVRGFLEEAGHTVEDFLPLSALEVLERVKACAPDLVITDYNMPHVDGQGVIRMVRRHSGTVPVLLLTASHDPAREERLRTHAPVTVLHKPVTGDKVVAAVKEMLSLS